MGLRSFPSHYPAELIRRGVCELPPKILNRRTYDPHSAEVLSYVETSEVPDRHLVLCVKPHGELFIVEVLTGVLMVRGKQWHVHAGEKAMKLLPHFDASKIPDLSYEFHKIER